MSLIEVMDAAGFREYLRKHKNTICGRNPIMLLLDVRAVRTDRGRENESDTDDSNLSTPPLSQPSFCVADHQQVGGKRHKRVQI